MKIRMKSVLGALLCGSLISGAAFAKMAPHPESCTAKESGNAISSAFFNSYRVDVFVYYETADGEVGRPAGGVQIFDLETNRLYGRTNDAGRLQITVAPGTRLRAVEPVYGSQQYVGDPIYNDKGEIIGWKAPK